MSLISLPNELLFAIASNISPGSLFNFLLVCRSLQSRLSHQMLQHALAPKDSVPAILWASEHNQTSLLITIFTHERPKIPSITTSDALRLACKHNHLAVAEFLIINGVNPSNDELILPTAIRNNNLDMVSLLLSHGVNSGIDRPHGCEPITFRLCRRGETPMLRLLLAAGADVNARNNHRSSCLTIAAEYGNTECVALLLAHGADVHVVDGDGDTPLLLAMKFRNYDIVNMLLESKCDLSTANHFGYTPLMVACKNGRVKEVAELLKRGAETEQEKGYRMGVGWLSLVDIAMKMGHTKVVKLLKAEEMKEVSRQLEDRGV